MTDYITMIRRTLGKYGNTDVIKLKPADKEHLGLNYGDDVDISEIKKIEEKEE